MKRIILFVLLTPVFALAQKEIKPSVSKAEAALQKGHFDEAKSIIDATVANQEFMVDKKGQPSKNASKAWYLKGMIYAAIDTTKVEKYKSLETNPFPISKESFEKCNCDAVEPILSTGMSEEIIIKSLGEPIKRNKIVTANETSDQWVYANDNFLYFKNGKLNAIATSGKPITKTREESLVSGLTMGLPLPLPISKDQVAKILAQKYLERGYAIYQKKDYKTAFVDIEKIMFFLPNDTSQLMNAGVYFAPAADENEKALVYIKRYKALGGKSSDALLQEYSIYSKRADKASNEGKEKNKQYDPLLDSVFMKNTNTALRVAQELSAKYPDNVDYLNMEYNIYTQTNRLPEAKALMEKRAKADPKDRESRYFLGLICSKLNDTEGAKHWLSECIKVDPDYFEANLALGQLTYADAQKLRNDRNAISGQKEADLKKRQELYKQIPVKLKECVVYWEKCVVVNSSDADALYGLLSVYSDISLYDESYEPKIVELKKKMKALGLEVD